MVSRSWCVLLPLCLQNTSGQSGKEGVVGLAAIGKEAYAEMGL
jgi:hypothetical protein